MDGKTCSNQDCESETMLMLNGKSYCAEHVPTTPTRSGGAVENRVTGTVRGGKLLQAENITGDIKF